MSKKITDLETVSALNDTDKFLVETENGSKAVPFNVIVEKSKPTLVSNLTTTTTGYALDAAQGKALNDKIGKVLWENTNPVEVDTMDITLSSDDYDVLDIYWLWNTTSNNMYVTSCLKGYCTSIKGYSIVGVGTDNPVAAVLIRETARNSNTSFTVNSILATNSGYDSNYLIPYKVVGRKLS